MTEYYYVGTLLPALTFETKPEITFIELMTVLRDNLSEQDYEQTKIFRLFFDLLNLRSVWSSDTLDPHGEMDIIELEEAILCRSPLLPNYVHEFAEDYPKIEERIRNFPFLIAKFFQSTNTLKNRFLCFYANFERELRLIWTAIRAKKLNRPLDIEFQYENPEEHLIVQLNANENASEQLPEQFHELKTIFEACHDDPLALHKALEQYRFDAIEKFATEESSFSLDRILAYLAQFIIIDQWFSLDQSKGIHVVETILKEINHHEKRA